MYKLMLTFITAVCVTFSGLASLSVVADESSSALFAQGKALFETNCALCHQSSGKGVPPAFPALVGNENLDDIPLIISNIRNGEGAMPAFPQLSVKDITALISYIRNAWGNELGGVTEQAIQDYLSASKLEEVAVLRSVWEGVYTKEQAKRGRPVYARTCTECHGDEPVALRPNEHRPVLSENTIEFSLVSDPGASGFSSAPPLAGGVFLRGWKNQTVANLYQYARSEMPQESPGSLTDQQYVDIIAYLFSLSSLPEGAQELPPDIKQLNMIIIEPKASKSNL